MSGSTLWTNQFFVGVRKIVSSSLLYTNFILPTTGLLLFPTVKIPLSTVVNEANFKVDIAKLEEISIARFAVFFFNKITHQQT